MGSSNDNKKSIYIDGIIYDLQNSGGISVYFSEIIKQLNIHLQSFKVKGVKKLSNKILIEYAQSDMISKGVFLVPLYIRRYLDVYVSSEYEVFHSSYYRLPLFNVRKNIKVITTVHDFTYEREIGGLKAKIHHFQKRRAILHSDIIVCISESTKKDLLHYIPEARKKVIKVIYNGVSNSFSPLKYEESGKNYILFVGARSGYKNFNLLVSAMSTEKNLNLIFIGGGGISANELGLLNDNLNGRYEHKPFVSNENLNLLYNNAFALVYPSLYEGFGIPAIEAMKSGCPVIASNTSSLPEICGDAAILLDNISKVSIRESIFRLHNLDFRASLINKGFKNAEKFSWVSTFQQLNLLYKGSK